MNFSTVGTPTTSHIFKHDLKIDQYQGRDNSDSSDRFGDEPEDIGKSYVSLEQF